MNDQLSLNRLQKNSDFKSLLFFLNYISIFVLLFIILSLLSNINILNRWIGRLIVGLPLIMQLFFISFVYKNNRKDKNVMYLLFFTAFITIGCALISIYEVLFTYFDYADEFIGPIICVQWGHQAILLILITILVLMKKVKKHILKIIISYVCVEMLMFCIVSINFFCLAAIILLISYFNPILIYSVFRIYLDDFYIDKENIFTKNES